MCIAAIGSGSTRGTVESEEDVSYNVRESLQSSTKVTDHNEQNTGMHEQNAAMLKSY